MSKDHDMPVAVALAARYQRIAIAGGPKTGKTTLASALKGITTRHVFRGDDYMDRGWSESSAALAEEVNAYIGPCIVEGVQVARALRKGLRVDAVLVLDQPHMQLTAGQAAMAKGCATVLAEWMKTAPGIPVLNAAASREEKKWID